MVTFYKIKDVAVQHFYSWEDGEDFDWLRRNWSKFNLSSEEDAKAFIYAAGYIYSTYVKEAFFLKHRVEYQTIEEYCEFKKFAEDISTIIKEQASR